ncbi:hypothetical protein L210DRAFT_3534207 [Boletus edulis BED1]|uniref:Probable 26S proteasome regulatory subunit p27 n=1 Tax=Boletus edulis BED1 TaxID=1328754 RepID=A0AAD4BXG5_BOLED|nr:hypothetical protein L210DRAFT_3534207 [Boletus edulis BED1]
MLCYVIHLYYLIFVMLPSAESPLEKARALVHVKDGIEAEISLQLSILRENNCDMTAPLVDSEGFPRADLDIYAIRSARTRIIKLRNDLKYTMDEIEKALHQVYDPSLAPPAPSKAPPVPVEMSSTHTEETLSPFAQVNGVAPGSPAAHAGLCREDLIIKFGHLTAASFSASSLEPLADLVRHNENHELRIQVLRDGRELSLQFTPRSGWGGRGLLGCHIVPYRPS